MGWKADENGDAERASGDTWNEAAPADDRHERQKSTPEALRILRSDFGTGLWNLRALRRATIKTGG